MTNAIHAELAENLKGTPEHETAVAKLRSTVGPSKGNLISLCEAITESNDGGKANVDAVKAWLASLSDNPPDTNMCKLKSIREKNTVLLIVGMRWVPVRTQILAICQQLGCAIKSDSAPPTSAELDLSAYLEALAQ